MQDESNPSGTPPVIFICYARKDNQDSDFMRCWLDRLRGHLKPLERQKKAIVWCDQRIDLGNEWDQDIHNALHSAKVAIALMSPAFFASDYICEKEIPAILQQVDEGKTTLLPILLSPFEPGAAEFEYGDPQTGKKVRSLMQIQAANGMNRSLLGLPEHEQDAVLAKVAQRVRETVSGKKSEGSDGAEPKKQTPTNLTQSGTETFVGRAETLREIDDRLQAGKTLAICAVSGMGGIGKTELALQYVLGQLRSCCDLGAVCWIDARQDIALQVVMFARSVLGLQLPELPELKELAVWCWRNFPQQDCLIVFDDVQEYSEIEAVLPPVELGFRVLLTTRARMPRGIQWLNLGVLSEAAALELLRKLVGNRRVDAELEAARQLCAWLGYLPLGLEEVGKHMATNKDLSLAILQEQLAFNSQNFSSTQQITNTLRRTETEKNQSSSLRTPHSQSEIPQNLDRHRLCHMKLELLREIQLNENLSHEITEKLTIKIVSDYIDNFFTKSPFDNS